MGPELVVVLTGPTGTGKSQLALQLAERLAPRMALEVVSADSAQVYRGMDIGTAKTDRAARARLPHHLIDIREPEQGYSVGEFVRDARESIRQIHARGRVPLVVGGTMMYLKALREGLADLPPASPVLRRQLAERGAAEGWEALHRELAHVDAAAAARIARSDRQRIHRALEVYLATGVPISEWQRRTASAAGRFRWLCFALWPASRANLRQRLGERFEAMLEAGLLEEVRALFARADLCEQHPSMRAVGYRQLWAYLAGRCSRQQAVEQAIRATGQLAKRQLTWLRADSAMARVCAEDAQRCATLAAAITAGARAAVP